MSFLSRLFGTGPDPKDALRPLWQAVVREARNPQYYAAMGVADTMDGRLDMLTAVLAFTILRMEQDGDLARDTAYLTELFVEDIDGQFRQQGIGDPTLGKKVGKIMGALGGRTNAYFGALTKGERSMTEAVGRNVTLNEGAQPEPLALAFQQFAARLAALSDEDILAGNIAA